LKGYICKAEMFYSDSMRSDVTGEGLLKFVLEVIIRSGGIRVALEIEAQWSNVMHSAFSVQVSSSLLQKVK
jgi:hypothetical protein